MKKLSEFDLFVSRRVRELRVARGITQSALAKCIGISPQQVQKYEDWSDRIGAGRLYQIAVCLGISVQEFFPMAEPHAATPERVDVDQEILRILSDPKNIELHRLIRQITDEAKRNRLIAFARELAGPAARSAAVSTGKRR